MTRSPSPALSRRGLVVGAAALGLVAAAPRALAQAGGGKPFSLDPLPYPADRNEPHIDARTMELHHGRHHAAYVEALNKAAGEGGWASRPLHEVLARLDDVPESVRTQVRNNGGGHANHTMFWQVMGGKGGKPTGDLAAAIDRDLGGFERFQAAFEAAGAGQFGSGWVFVTVEGDGRLAITTRPNQDTPLMEGKRVLMGNDVWEHAYYLKYQNRRADYLDAWWNVVDWERVADRYARARAGTLTI